MKKKNWKKQRYGAYYMRKMEPIWEEKWNGYQKRIKFLKKDIQHLGPIPQKETQLISTVNYFVKLINLISNFADKGMACYTPEDKVEIIAKFNAIITSLVARDKLIHQYMNKSKIGENVTPNNLYLGMFSQIKEDEIASDKPTIEINGELRKVEVNFAPISDWINNRVISLSGRSCHINQKDLAITLREIIAIILEAIDAVLD